MPDLAASTVQGEQVHLGEASVADLRRSLRGAVLTPGASEYNETRALWNALHDKKPALIVRCANSSDVIQSVNFARATVFLLPCVAAATTCQGAAAAIAASCSTCR